MLGTVAAIEKHLLTDGFVARYAIEQRSGWTSARRRARSCPALSGWPTTMLCKDAQADARKIFERLLAVRNDVGLLSEEYDPRAGGSWGTSRRPSRTSASSIRRET